MEKTIRATVKLNLCISCGACVAICPKSCIKFTNSDGMFLPQVDNSACIGCAQCSKVCPVYSVEGDIQQDVETYVLGNYLKIVCAASNSETLRMKAASGGVVTQLVEQLLKSGDYDAAYLLDGYHYDTLQKVKRYNKDSDLSSSFKSRYLTVSHEDTIRNMLAHPEEKLILVGTGCCVQALTNVMRARKLNRENYCIIGLFCDKTMHYGVVDYFSEHTVSVGRDLHELYFRTKEAGGWPGNLRLTYSDGSYVDLPNTERINVKDYFMPERCMYCLDKLNRLSDIAVGDNYIPENASSDGYSSVIIRTELGMRTWEKCSTLFEYKPDQPEQILSSQHLKLKQSNYQNRIVKGLREGTASPETKKLYRKAIHKMTIGKQSHCYSLIQKEIRQARLRNKFRVFFRRIKKFTEKDRLSR